MKKRTFKKFRIDFGGCYCMRRTFRGGIHPLRREHEGKNLTASVPIQSLPAPKVVRIPLRQSVGKPSVPIVEIGDRVLMGQMIARADGFVSVPLHASVSGTVTAIEPIPDVGGKTETAMVIENDFTDEKFFRKPGDYTKMQDSDIIRAIQDAGIVGMGGAGFPTHVKLSPPPQKHVDLLIINGAECEPFLTADARLMLEHPEKIIEGTRIMMRALNVKHALIGIEDNKPEAIAAMEQAASRTRTIRVRAMETKYPQGYEKTLIYALTGRVVPAGGLPMDAQVVVANAASAAAVADYFMTGEPSIRRIVTVSGAVANPANFLIRIGTSMHEAIQAAGGFQDVPMKIISGGPMMGKIIPTTECVVTKNTSGIVTLDSHYTKHEKETPCIRCGKCGDSCPMNLSPMMLADSAEADDFDTAARFHAMDCMSCGTCSFICPANRPLAQSIAFAKMKLTARRIQEQKEREEQEKKEQQKSEEKETPAEDAAKAEAARRKAEENRREAEKEAKEIFDRAPGDQEGEIKAELAEEAGSGAETIKAKKRRTIDKAEEDKEAKTGNG